jgi:hypothetical protein
MQFAEPTGFAILQVYDHDVSAHTYAQAHTHSHGVPMAMMLTPHHDPKTGMQLLQHVLDLNHSISVICLFLTVYTVGYI